MTKAPIEEAKPFEVDYPVAISNRLFKDSEVLKDPPCQHCNMISMGEMVCYQDFCPECGKIPPNRKRQEYWFMQSITPDQTKQTNNGAQKLMLTHTFYGTSVPEDFPPLITLLSNRKEKNVPKKEELLQFKNGNAMLLKNVKETLQDCCIV